MGRLPPHHIRRPRLTVACLGERVVVVEAAAGYGKSVLAAELVEAWRAVAIEVLLEEGDVSAQLLAGRLQAAVMAAGFREAARSMTAAGSDAAGAVDAALASLAGESCALVIDDAHHVGRAAGRLIARIAGRLGGDQHLVVLARHLPPGSERLRRADALHLTGADLALGPEESLELGRSAFGLDIDAAAIRALTRATGGWTAATVLALSRARRTGEPLGAVARVAGAGGPTGAVAALLEEALAGLGSDRGLLAQLGRLPQLWPDLVDELAAPGYFDRALAAGLPLSPGPEERWELPGAVRDHLASLAPADPVRLRRAADHYQRRGDLSGALRLLLASGDLGAATELLAAAVPRAVEAIDVLELQAVADRLPAALVDDHPQVLLHLARSYEGAALLVRRQAALARVAAIAARSGDGHLQRALDAETACDHIRDSRFTEGEDVARRVLAGSSSPGEALTRARALSALGRATCWRFGGGWERREAALREASGYLEQAAVLYLELGLRSAAAGLAPYRAIWVEFACGRPQAALDLLDQALELVVDRPRRFAYVLIFRAEVLAELGRHMECETVVAEVLRICERLGGTEQLAAYGHWQLAISHSLRGNAELVLEHVRRVETHRGDWWAVASGDFLADAAEVLDRVGHVALAREYLERARSTPADSDAQRVIQLADAVLLARHGDPVLAEERLARMLDGRLDLREYWRVTLMRAYAAFRGGDPRAGALAAAAFEQASRLGQPQLPLLRERAVSEALLALAAETGQPAALALERSSLPVALAVLGRFELTIGGRPVPLGSGQAGQLLKLIAVSRGRIPAERAIEALWPDADRDSGRNRLRTVLNRLREAGGEIVTRAGEQLVLTPAVTVDLALFHREARQAIALGQGDATSAVALARSAIARYRGDLLPDDPYLAWAEGEREATRRTALELLDLCASAAATSGDLDEARRVVERTIELAPYDDERYLKAASLLLQQGRRGAALTLVRRAEAALAELGLRPPAPLVQLERAIGA